ncbi:hypothetical protein HDV06_002283 [Boothiomyces sp. JEL0866]|nr:hypothetical protein HDV06_002283 [Boothiomyces sp. JEL0866]
MSNETNVNMPDVDISSTVRPLTGIELKTAHVPRAAEPNSGSGPNSTMKATEWQSELSENYMASKEQSNAVASTEIPNAIILESQSKVSTNLQTVKPLEEQSKLNTENGTAKTTNHSNTIPQPAAENRSVPTSNISVADSAKGQVPISTADMPTRIANGRFKENGTRYVAKEDIKGSRVVYQTSDQRLVHEYRMETFEDFRRHMNKDEWESLSRDLMAQPFHKSNCSVWAIAPTDDMKNPMAHVEVYNVPAMCKINGRIVQGMVAILTGLHTRAQHVGRNYSNELLSTLYRVYKQRKGYIGMVAYCPKSVNIFERVGLERFTAHSLFYERLLTNRHLQPPKDDIELLTFETARKFMIDDASRVINSVFESDVNVFTMIPEPSKQQYLDARSRFMAKYFGYKQKYYDGVTLKGTDNYFVWFMDFQRRSFTITRHYVTSEENCAKLLQEAVNQALLWNFHLLQVWSPSKYFDRRQFNRSCYFEINRSIDVPHLAFFGDWKKLDSAEVVDSLNNGVTQEQFLEMLNARNTNPLVKREQRLKTYDSFLKEVFQNANTIRLNTQEESKLTTAGREGLEIVIEEQDGNPAKRQRLDEDVEMKATKENSIQQNTSQSASYTSEKTFIDVNPKVENAEKSQTNDGNCVQEVSASNEGQVDTPASKGAATAKMDVDEPVGNQIEQEIRTANVNSEAMEVDEIPNKKSDYREDKKVSGPVAEIKPTRAITPTVKIDTETVDTAKAEAPSNSGEKGARKTPTHNQKECKKGCTEHKHKRSKRYSGPRRQIAPGTQTKVVIQEENDEWWDNLKFEWQNNEALFWL